MIWLVDALKDVLVPIRLCVTVTVRAEETELELLAVPAYEAVIVCGPAASVEVLHEAVPPAFSAAEPTGAPPSRKVTVPVGVAVPVCGTTEAVKATLWPVFTWVAEADKVVAVATAVCVTVTVTVGEEDELNPGVPP